MALGDVLGQGEHTAAVFTRNGKQRLLDLDGITEGSWNRVTNAYSEASVTVSAKLRPSCWDGLGDVHTWAHTLVVFRNGDRVWEGPITYTGLGTGSVVFNARDVTSWMTRRRVRLKRILGKHDPDVPALGEAEQTINRAFAPDDPNVTSHLIVIPDATTDKPMVDRALHINDGTYYDDLTALVDHGINFTTAGRAIIVWTDNKTPGRTPTLIPERDITGDVLLVEDGERLATKVTAAVDKKAATVIAHGLISADGVSDFYGLHDMLTDPHGRKKVPDLRKVARRAQRHRYPVPQSLVIPDGATLNPSAPLPIEVLVPGVKVPVESVALVRRVSTLLLLDKVAVTFGPEGETVAVTLVPHPGPADTEIDDA